MRTLQLQNRVDGCVVVMAAFQVMSHNHYHSTCLKAWPKEGPRIERHFPAVIGQSVPVPDPEAVILSLAKKQPFMTRGEQAHRRGVHILS
jgi:hypothetical protein